MGLTIVGCGYVGLAVATRLQPRRSQWPLTLTTTRQERCTELETLADRVLICEASQPTQLMAALEHSHTAVFTLGPKGNRQVDADGYRRTFLESFTCLRSLLPQLPQLQQIIYTGSCSVYGDAAGGWVDESTTPDPSPGHGSVLLESEQLLAGMADRRICILRLGALHGPGRDLDDRLKGLAGQERPGDGGSISNWVHVDDAAGAVLAAIDGGWSGVVNVVNDEPIRIRDLVQQSLERQNLDPVRWSGEPTQRTNGRRIRNHRLKALGYQLLHPTVMHPTVNSQSGVLPVSQVP